MKVETTLRSKTVPRDTMLRRTMDNHWRNVLRARAQGGSAGQAMLHSAMHMKYADGLLTITSTLTAPETANAA